MSSNPKADISFCAFKLTTCDENYRKANQELRAAIKHALDTVERLESADLDRETRHNLEVLSDRAHRIEMFLK